jgi:hypothetical protein
MSDELRFMYLGPNFPKGMLRRGTVYKGGLPPVVDELRAQVPALVDLFIPVGSKAPRVAAARVELKTPGSRLAALNGAVQAWLRADARRRHGITGDEGSAE